jgi:hypothetical protein
MMNSKDIVYAASFDALKAGTIEARGTFSVNGDVFTFESDDICGTQPGVYRLTARTAKRDYRLRGSKKSVGSDAWSFWNGCPEDIPMSTALNKALMPAKR